MNLSKFLLTLKGGSGSGNWGHRGRLGHHGGSSPGGGLKAIGASSTSSVDERRELKKKVPSLRITTEWEDPSTWKRDDEASKMIRKYAKAIEDFEDPSGLKIKVNSISYGSFSHSVSGSIIDPKTGNKVGRFTRDFMPSDKEVHHDFFQLEQAYQGTGFGARFYYASERLYPSMGYNKVSIFANIDVGGYAWARMGYDFQRNQAKQDWGNRFVNVYRSKFNQEPPFVPKSAYEIAAYKGPDGSRIGKDMLLGQSWEAIKNLNAKDPGYQAGLEYYKSKGIL